MKHPMQPLVWDKHGTIRFKENAIVNYILDHCRKHGVDMNHLADKEFSQEDREQFAQLIGYSVGGYLDLSYVSDESYDEALKEANKLIAAGEPKVVG